MKCYFLAIVLLITSLSCRAIEFHEIEAMNNQELATSLKKGLASIRRVMLCNVAISVPMFILSVSWMSREIGKGDYASGWVMTAFWVSSMGLSVPKEMR